MIVFAGATRFELILTVLETVALPLNYTPKKFQFCGAIFVLLTYFNSPPFVVKIVIILYYRQVILNRTFYYTNPCSTHGTFTSSLSHGN